jgi:hypothetical protein
MSTKKRFNKFGQYGIEKVKMNDRSRVIQFNSDERMILLKNAKNQLRDLETLKDELSWTSKKQYRKLKNAFYSQRGVLSEEQLRWLQRVYDERFDFKSRPKNPTHLSLSEIAKITWRFIKKS